MKKLYKGKIHPSPPLNDDHFFLLPAAMIMLAAALSPQDKEVLAYLISCNSSSSSSTSPNNFSGNTKSTNKAGGSGRDHAAEFTCDCFRCYMSYWVRWDASPNRQLIHEIIEAYEDGAFDKKDVVKGKKDGRRKTVSGVAAAKDDRGGGSGDQLGTAVEMEMNFLDEVISGDGNLGGCDQEQSGLPCTVRKLVSFMGERIWGVWGII